MNTTTAKLLQVGQPVHRSIPTGRNRQTEQGSVAYTYDWGFTIHWESPDHLSSTFLFGRHNNYGDLRQTENP